MTIQYVDPFPRSITANPSFQLFADTGLTVYPLDAANNYAPILSMAVRLGPGTLPNTLSTVLLPGQLIPTQVSAAFEVNSTTGAVLFPRVTLTQRNNMIPTNGMQVYNITSASMDMFIGGEWHEFTEGSGTGDVVGPDGAFANSIPIFGDTTGKLLADSAVEIEQIPILARIGSIQTNGIALANATQLGPIGYLKFDSTQGPAIYVDALSPLNFNENTSGEITNISTVFTGGVPAASTSVSALVELQGTDAVMMLNSLTTTEMNALVNPQNGYILYNETAGKIYARQGGTFSQLGGSGSTFPDGTYILPRFTVSGGAVSGQSNLGFYDGSNRLLSLTGSGTALTGSNQTLIGPGDSTVGNNGITIGTNTYGTGQSINIGIDNITKDAVVCLGYGNTSNITDGTSKTGTMIGFNNTNNGLGSIAIGNDINIAGERVVAIGDNIDVSGGENYAVLIGLNISEIAEEDFIFGTNIVSNPLSTKGNILIGRHINANTGTTGQHIVIGNYVDTSGMLSSGLVFAIDSGGGTVTIPTSSYASPPVIFCTDNPLIGGSDVAMGINVLDPGYALEVNHRYDSANAIHLCENPGIPTPPSNGGALLFSDGINVYFTLANGNSYRINGTPV